MEDNLMLLALIVAYYYKIVVSKKNVRRSMWVRPSKTVQKRLQQGDHDNLIKELRMNDVSKYKNYMRMSPESFDKLLSIVGPSIQKCNGSRRPIDPCTKLEVTLRYLATGQSMTSIGDQFRLGTSTVSEIIKVTTKAIYENMTPIVMPEMTQQSWLESAQGFLKRWNFPHCIGAVDGKHIAIEQPPHSGSSFFTYKGFHSMVLMAVCDYRYRFLTVDVGAPGRMSDANVFRNSKMGVKFEHNQMNVPEASEISEEGSKIPYFLVGDEAFGLKKYLQRPYPGRSTGKLEFHQRIFNYRLSRARRTIENAFGILVAKWRIFRAPIQADIDTIEYIMLAATCLHNFALMEEEDLKPHQKSYCPNNFVDSEEGGEFVKGQWRKESLPVNTFLPIRPEGSNNQTGTQSFVREKLAQYCINEGAVYWQWTHELH